MWCTIWEQYLIIIIIVVNAALNFGVYGLKRYLKIIWHVHVRPFRIIRTSFIVHQQKLYKNSFSLKTSYSLSYPILLCCYIINIYDDCCIPIVELLYSTGTKALQSQYFFINRNNICYITVYVRCNKLQAAVDFLSFDLHM